MNNKKQLILSIGLVLVLVLMIVGISYAAFQFTGPGSKVNSITTGAITMEYTESNNVINITGALPTTDKTGMIRLNDGEYFDFTVKSNITGTANINWEISAKKLDGNTIDGKYVKLYLTKLINNQEESLTAPLTYFEDTEANSYTGRPSNEMSLYTGNMTSSEEGTYRLRMYIDEDYNPQGDGGNLTFGVKVNVYGQIGNKETPKTTTTILAANALQETKEHMFNYTSSGKQYDAVNKKELEADSNYVTNGLYSAEDEDGTSYYFRGNVTNNNVQFGEYKEDYYVYYLNGAGSYYQSLKNCYNTGKKCDGTKEKLASKGDKMYWKIVRINGDGSLRLLYNGINPSTTSASNKKETWKFVSDWTSYSYKNDDAKYSGYTYDNGTNSLAKDEMDTWYKNSLANTAYDKMVKSGRFCSDSSGYKEATAYGFTDANSYYFASTDRLAQTLTGFAKDNSPTFKCPTTNEAFGGSYRLKAGLLTADELTFGGRSYAVNNDDDYFGISGSGFYFNLTSTPFGYLPISSTNNTKRSFVFRNYKNDLEAMGTGSGSTFGVVMRPVINVSSNNGFISGDGSLENPYVIAAE